MLKQIFIFFFVTIIPSLSAWGQSVRANFTVDTVQSCDTISIQFHNYSVPETSIDSLIWYFGDGDTSSLPNPIHLFDTVGVFNVKLTVFNTTKNPIDSSSFQKKIYIYGHPNANFNYKLYGYPSVNDTFFYSYQKYLITATKYSNDKHSWWIDNIKQISDTSQMGINFKKDGEYLFKHEVWVSHYLDDTITCYSQAEKTIKILPDSIKIPNIFTPNGDGENDLFFIQTDGNTKYTLVIYNRFGNKVFLTEGTIISWDGYSYWGEALTTGTYYYVLRSDKGKEYKGRIFLNR